MEALISINNQLRQPDAAVGVLNVAQKELHMDLKESWWVGAGQVAGAQMRGTRLLRRVGGSWVA